MVAELTLGPSCFHGCYLKEENLNHSGGVSAVLFWTSPYERRGTCTRTTMMEVAEIGSNSRVSRLLDEIQAILGNVPLMLQMIIQATGLLARCKGYEVDEHHRVVRSLKQATTS
jgi:hypothetical protein